MLTDRGQQAIAAARRDGAMLAVMVMDLNRFKEVNDSLGHHHGDLLLRELGNRLRGSLRDIDTVARFGGDEFAMLLARVSSVNSAVAVADKVRDLVRLPLVLKDLTLSMDSSIGIAMFPEHGHDWASLMQHADVAMYVAKAAGSGREVYAGDGVEHSSSREALVRDMKNAIQTEELVLHYQPQLEIASGHVATVEALVRWQHPGRGLLWPGEFLAIAETTNSIDDLTRVVATIALRQLNAWRSQDLEFGMSINLSARNLISLRLPYTLAKLLEHYTIPPQRLSVEVSEAAITNNLGQCVRTLARLRALGIGVFLDNFGAAHSALAYLKRLPITGIKIDESSVATMHEPRATSLSCAAS